MIIPCIPVMSRSQEHGHEMRVISHISEKQWKQDYEPAIIVYIICQIAELLDAHSPYYHSVLNRMENNLVDNFIHPVSYFQLLSPSRNDQDYTREPRCATRKAYVTHPQNQYGEGVLTP